MPKALILAVFVMQLILASDAVAEQDEWQNLLDGMAQCASDKEPCEVAFRDACGERGSWTTYAMVQCEDQIYRYWDDVLNWTYGRVMPAAKAKQPHLYEQLKAAQRAWIAYRDTRCQTYGYYQGTIWRMVGVSCAVTMTQDRIVDLEEAAVGGDLSVDPDIDWDKATTADIDLDCDGRAETVIAGVQKRLYDQSVVLGVSYSDGRFIDGPIHEFPINAAVQEAVCGVPISLEAVTTETAPTCPVLRIDDGLCDALFLGRESADGDYVTTRH